MVFAFVHFHAIVLTILAWNCACNGHYPGKNKSCLAVVVLVLSFSASKLMSVLFSWCRCMTGLPSPRSGLKRTAISAAP
jgi:hypothetical protein